mmetsp:Transcript_28418/g.59002  ORF Transcript_28418/g.59002 Transcript_28418/m.59002 type:complete len:243 (+) Transcript_28418:327-1055(+)
MEVLRISVLPSPGDQSDKVRMEALLSDGGDRISNLQRFVDLEVARLQIHQPPALELQAPARRALNVGLQDPKLAVQLARVLEATQAHSAAWSQLRSSCNVALLGGIACIVGGADGPTGNADRLVLRILTGLLEDLPREAFAGAGLAAFGANKREWGRLRPVRGNASSTSWSVQLWRTLLLLLLRGWHVHYPCQCWVLPFTPRAAVRRLEDGHELIAGPDDVTRHINSKDPYDRQQRQPRPSR